jgi:hypothetical protein
MVRAASARARAAAAAERPAEARRRPRPASAPRQRPTAIAAAAAEVRRSATPRARRESRGGAAARKVILEMTVEIGDGRTDVISVRKADHARELALDFVERNRLAAKVVDPLTDHIESHLAKLRRDETVAARSRRGRSASRERGRALSAPRSRSRSRSRSRGRAASPPSHHTFKPAVNPVSTKIAETMGDREGTAFDRLHQESKMRRVEARRRAEDCDARLDQRRERTKTGMSGISRALAETRGELNGAANYGDKLFREGVMHARQKEELLTEIRQQEEMRKEGEDLTFKPKISRAARKQRSKVLDDYRGEGRARRQEEREREKDEQEVKGCSFQPRIPGTSRELARRSKRAEELRRRQEEHEEEYEAVTVHDELAADVHERQRRLDAYETSEFHPHGATFHPDVGVAKLRPRTDRDDEAFVDRLVNSNRERERQLDLVRARQSMGNGAEPAFQPRISKAPEGEGGGSAEGEGRRRPEKMSVHEHLYASREQFVDIKNTLAEREDQKRWADANRCHTKKKSQQHIDARRRRRAREIFRRLAGARHATTPVSNRRASRGGGRSPDGDRSGSVQYIDTKQLCLDGITKPLAKELVPELLRSTQAARGDGMIDFETFYAIVEDIAADETTEVRAVLHHRPLPEAEAEERRRQAEEAECTSKPRINPVSREIAEQLAGPGDGHIHERNLTKKTRQRELQEAKRAAMEEAELEECTFQPRTNQSALAAWRAYRQKEPSSSSTAGGAPDRRNSKPASDPREVDDEEEDDALEAVDGFGGEEVEVGFDLAQSRDILRRLAEKVRQQEGSAEGEAYDDEGMAEYE